MARTLHVAFVWHMHQPHYKDRASGRYLMPWARMHATKDYLDMVEILAGYPAHHQTFNLVPSLLAQLVDYAEHEAWDHALTLLVRPVAEMAPEDRQYLFERAFDVHAPTMVRPYPRYAGLLDQRDALRSVPARRAIAAFADQDWADLVTWFNLAWFDPHWLATDPVLAALVAKGQGFDEADRQALCAQIRAYVGRVIPAYAKAAAAGQVELTTTPYYHPILPLLCDATSARIARPDLPLPATPFSSPADADEQLARGLAAFEQHFGYRPAGLWPSEQAVSPPVLALAARHGLRWTISDEAVLARSLGVDFGRDAGGVTPNAAWLYQAWRVPTAEGPVAMVFRDVVLSDMIGFTYARWPAELAAEDLHRRLDRIRRLLPDGEGYCVTIALDGENCWEHYPQDGGPFLHAFYRRIEADPAIALVTVSEHLAAHPPRRELPQLHAGSWIGADFTTWIGEPTKNLAWEALQAAHEAVASTAAVLAGSPAWAEAREELLIAEGSDWFWWYGEGHDSGQDENFDALFRMHLRRAYARVGVHWPEALGAPLVPPPPAIPASAGGMPAPRLDGMLGDPAWAAAVHLDVGSTQGAMHAAAHTVAGVRYGCDADQIYLGLAYADAYAPGDDDELGLFFYHPGQVRLNAPMPYATSDAPLPPTAGFGFAHAVLVAPARARAIVAEAGEHGAWHAVAAPTAWASRRALELAVPLAVLDLAPGQELRCVVAVARAGRLVEVLPDVEGLALTAPARDLLRRAG